MDNHTIEGFGNDSVLASVSDRLQHESHGGSLEWWRTPTATVIVELAKTRDFVSALAGITEALQSGEDPMWVVGGTTAQEAFAVAQEWVDAGVHAIEVADWLRAGCWDPKAAKLLVDVGIHPDRLLDEHGRPIHWADGPDGSDMSVALAVADGFLTIEDAVQAVMEP